jgi:hypothetical protein
MRRRILAVFLSVIVVVGCASRRYTVDLNNREYQEDFDQIVRTLTERHPGFLRELMPIPWIDSLKNHIDSIRSEIAAVKDHFSFYFLVSEFLSKLEDGHTRVSWDAFARFPSLPFQLAWFQDSLYVINVSDTSLEDLKYCPLLSIAGKPIDEIDKMACKFISTDKNNSYLRKAFGYGTAPLIINGRFLMHMKLWNGNDSMEYDKNGCKTKKAVSLILHPKAPGYHSQARSRITEQSEKNVYRVDTTSAILYIQLNQMPIFGKSLFFSKAFKAGRRSHATRLVVDLRHCEGGWSAWANDLLSYILRNKKCCFTSEGWQRNGNRLIGPTKESCISPALEEGFEGRTYILTSGFTASSATFIVIGVQDNGLGLIVGDPCGNNDVRYGDSRKIRLRYTGMTLHYSTKIWKRAKLSEIREGKPIKPDYIVNTTIEDYRKRQDPVWNFVEKLILTEEDSNFKK